MSPPPGVAGDVLRALADLAPGDRAGPSDLVDITGGDDPWLALDPAADLAAVLVDDAAGATIGADRTARRIQAFDALHAEEQVLRLGWGFLTGRIEVDARPRRVCTPLLVRPVRLRLGSRGRLVVEPAGELELGLPIGTDQATVLESTSPLHPSPFVDPAAARPGPQAWFDAVLGAAGLPKSEVLPATTGFRAARQLDRSGIVPGFALFIDRAARPGARAARLRQWAAVDGIDATAFAELYQP
nr:hypothetical protein [Acidimicrobiia bacterium]